MATEMAPRALIGWLSWHNKTYWFQQHLDDFWAFCHGLNATFWSLKTWMRSDMGGEDRCHLFSKKENGPSYITRNPSCKNPWVACLHSSGRIGRERFWRTQSIVIVHISFVEFESIELPMRSWTFWPWSLFAQKNVAVFLSKSRRWRFSDGWCRKFDEPHINESMSVTHNILRILFAYPNSSCFLLPPFSFFPPT